MYYTSENALTKNGIDGLFVATALRTTSKAIDLFDNTSFLYDPDWVADKDSATLPLAFMNTVTCQEVRHNEVAQKRVIVYTNNSLTDTTKKLTKMSVISDNIISTPKKYKLETIVPSVLDNYFTPFSKTLAAAAEGFSRYGWGDSDAEADIQTVYKLASVNSNVATIVTSIISILESMSATTQVKSYVKSTIATALTALGVNGNFFDSLQVPYNKNSLDRMAESRHILTLKNWDSWDYKYVVINDVQFDKSGENGDNYMCTLELQEFPVMVIHNISDTVSGGVAWYSALQTKLAALAGEIITDLGELET